VASPLRQAGEMCAAVLLIHGKKDSWAPIEESRRFALRPGEPGRIVKLLEIKGAGHVFIFWNAALARQTWSATLEWLDTHMKGICPIPCRGKALPRRGRL
jgi:dipeptidyl aminopeptidase/acylaminoacyl peptidase